MRNEHEHKSQSLTLEEVTQHAKEMLLEQGQHQLTFILEGDQRTLAMLLEDVASTHDERMQQMFSVGFVFAQDDEIGKLKQAFLIAEAWMNRLEPDQPNPVRPSLDPKRREVLLVSNFFTDGRETNVRVIEMHRDSQGVLRELKEEPAYEQANARIDGPLIEAFLAGYNAGRSYLINANEGGKPQ